MATMSKFPPDVPKSWNEAQDEIGEAAESVRAKAAGLADRASESVKDGYHRAKDAITDMDPIETVREGGEAVVRAVERNPLAAFGLGALSVGLIAWAALRQPAASSWEPHYGRMRRLFSDYGGDEALEAGQGALRRGKSWLGAASDDASDYADHARSYARHGGRYLARRTEKEPLAALLGVGIAVYVIGSLLTSNSEPEPARRRSSKR